MDSLKSKLELLKSFTPGKYTSNYLDLKDVRFISRILNINIFVWDNSRKIWFVYGNFNNLNIANKENSIFIYFNGINHFNSLNIDKSLLKNDFSELNNNIFNTNSLGENNPLDFRDADRYFKNSEYSLFR